jgi:exodeoxyribonuclease VII large subunit
MTSTLPRGGTLFDPMNSSDQSLESNLGSPKPYTVSSLSQALKSSVEETFNNIQVRGEVSGAKYHTSGHLYFALKDKDALLDMVCWRGSVSRLECQPQDGMDIICQGRLTTFPGRSKYQMVVEKASLAGVGQLLQNLEALKAKLGSEGLFLEERKKALPPYPKVIGIITSPTGAVIKDILHRLQDRWPVKVLLWPVAVQGIGAAHQIAEAIKGFEKLPPSISKPDLLIVARGGGSLEDLWCFNEEIVVRAVAQCSIPLISAVGHETDVTLIDFASDRRAPTPTAAAEMAVPVLSQTKERCHQYRNRLHRIIIPMIDERHMKTIDKSDQIDRIIHRYLREQKDKLKHRYSRLRHPKDVIVFQEQMVKGLSGRLIAGISKIIDRHSQRVSHQSRGLDALSYRRVLERGFTFVQNQQGQNITSSLQLSTLERVTIHWHDGQSVAEII